MRGRFCNYLKDLQDFSPRVQSCKSCLKRKRMISVFPERERFPVRWSAHAAKNERCSCSEKFAAAVFPLGFRADDPHAVRAKGKNRKGRGIVEASLAGKALFECGKFRVATHALCNPGFCALVPETRMVCADVAGVCKRIPVATIGRSLSGEVTGGVVPYLPLRCNGASFKNSRKNSFRRAA